MRELPHNKLAYDDPQFYQLAEANFESRRPFSVMARPESVLRLRKAVALFLRCELEKMHMFRKWSLLLQLALPGLRAALLLAVCNTALRRHWQVKLGSAETEVAALSPPAEPLTALGSNALH
jgi:hypothetical protein